MTVIDLSDQLYGKLLVTSLSHRDSYGDSMWNCSCECGNKCVVRLGNLRSGHTVSCVQCSTEKRVKVSIGEVYGRLRVLRRRKDLEKDSLLYECECNCGNLVVIRSQSLREGVTQSCGCLHKERITKHGLSNTKEYRQLTDNKRRELKKLHDSKWSIEMEFSLRELQTQCVICSSKDSLAVDHLYPLSKGNGLCPGNAVILCGTCNNKKNAKDISKLPSKIAEKLIASAEEFRLWWEENSSSYQLRPY